MKKVCRNKKVNLDKTFLPKRKRVLNKRTLSVLNGNPNKKIKVASPQPVEDDVTQDLLDSQFSISACFVESQSRSPAAPPLASRVPFSQSQTDGPASPLASRVPFSQSQTESPSLSYAGSPRAQAAGNVRSVWWEVHVWW